MLPSHREVHLPSASVENQTLPIGRNTLPPPHRTAAGRGRRGDRPPLGRNGADVHTEDPQEDMMSAHAYLTHRSATTAGVLTGTFRRTGRLTDDEASNRAVNQAVARAKQGDREALRFLYVRYADHVYGYVASVVRDDFEAEDVTQHVFAKLMTTLQKYEPREVPFSAWIIRVARNVAVDHMRQRRAIPCEEVRELQVARRRGRVLAPPLARPARRARGAARRSASGRRDASPRRALPGRDRRQARPHRTFDPRPASPRPRCPPLHAHRDGVRPADQRKASRLTSFHAGGAEVSFPRVR